MGEIVYKTLVRLFLLIILLWFFKNSVESQYFWIISFLSIYLFVINPAYLAYKVFLEKNDNVIQNSLCTSCKHFDKSAVLCMKYDKHPTEEFIPCEGTAWEPK